MRPFSEQYLNYNVSTLYLSEAEKRFHFFGSMVNITKLYKGGAPLQAQISGMQEKKPAALTEEAIESYLQSVAS